MIGGPRDERMARGLQTPGPEEVDANRKYRLNCRPRSVPHFGVPVGRVGLARSLRNGGSRGFLSHHHWSTQTTIPQHLLVSPSCAGRGGSPGAAVN